MGTDPTQEEPLIWKEKDAFEENLLENLNISLEELEATLEKTLDGCGEEPVPVFLVGAPRSGTTLLSQLVSSCLDVGYINNLIAAFWKVPTVGVSLSRKLLSDRPRTDFRSCYGRTGGIEEPHEFGYFWSELLGNRDLGEPVDRSGIDWELLVRRITAMAAAFGKPLVFKSFHALWFTREMADLFPRSIFVRITRDPLENAASLVKLRRGIKGSVEEWASLRPREADRLCREHYGIQVAGQLFYIDRYLHNELARLPAERKLELRYEELCRDPAGVLSAVAEKLEDAWPGLRRRQEPPEPFAVRRASAELTGEELDRVREGLRRFGLQ